MRISVHRRLRALSLNVFVGGVCIRKFGTLNSTAVLKFNADESNTRTRMIYHARARDDIDGHAWPYNVIGWATSQRTLITYSNAYLRFLIQRFYLIKLMIPFCYHTFFRS